MTSGAFAQFVRVGCEASELPTHLTPSTNHKLSTDPHPTPSSNIPNVLSIVEHGEVNCTELIEAHKVRVATTVS